MTGRFKDYLREAFHAKPLGMFVSPNWVGLTAAALLGVLNPGFWLIGAGLELGYLYALLQSPRFRRWVDSQMAGQSLQTWQAKLNDCLARLPAADAGRLSALEERCRGVLARQEVSGARVELEMQAEGFGRLLWIFHGLLQTRETLRQIFDGAPGSTAVKLARIEAQLLAEKDESVRRSLSAQIEILHQREATQKEGRAKVDYLDAELVRIEEQVELIREQSLLAADPATLSKRIDEIGSTLGETTHWIREQQKLYGDVQDIMEEAPPIPLPQTQ